MSRIIVKNLPENIKESRLREIFSDHGGEITDLKLCFTKKGIFRKFAFIGYKSDQEASHAVKALNKTFIDTSKITVESCCDLGDTSLSRPWSKYSKGSSAFRRHTKEVEDRKNRIKELQLGEKERKKKKKKKNIVLEQLDDVKDDQKFQEFLAVHEKQSKQMWSNENIVTTSKEKKNRKKKSSNIENVSDKNIKPDINEEKGVVKNNTDDDDDNDDRDDDDDDGDDDDDDHNEDSVGVADPVDNALGSSDEGNDMSNNDDEDNDVDDCGDDVNDNQLDSDADSGSGNAIDEEEGSKISNKPDMNWLKGKVSKTKQQTELTVPSESKDTLISLIESKPQDTSVSSSSEEDRDEDIAMNAEENVPAEQLINCLTIKMRGIPFKSKEEDIIKFFKPAEIDDIRFTKNKQGKPSGYAFVDFKTVEDARRGMKKDKQEMKGRYIELFLAPHKGDDDSNKFKKESWNVTEDVSETGRIFIRNLSYTCTEGDLESLFSTYGNLVEVNLPIDKNSNKATGFAFITFMMPEHALKAWTELDGKVFQGRILHIIPGKPKKDENDTNHPDSSYKKKKEAEKKALSGSAHNWNALFLGQNAVADAMAARLNTTKRDLLDGGSEGSVAVRMALGETELVSETRKFLESHGVKLDVFGQANAARSKSIILAKNLPPGTTKEEMSDIFSKHGQIGQILMPPFGITAIVEFINANDAKKAFLSLAYSKFKHTPLYLEWAPVDVLSGNVTIEMDEIKEGESGEDSESEELQGTVIFVKNLSFDTNDEKLKAIFSSCGKIKEATVAKKKDPKKSGSMLSMGYGFVKFKKLEDADKAIKNLQGCQLDGHKLELKKSHRETTAPKSSRKRATDKKQTSSKIVVRNIPFEANVKEVKDLFSTFGIIKSIRLPKKMAGTGSHRGFAFIDFATKQEAKRAFKALCQSTHLYGRRLVLEWAEDDSSVNVLQQKTAQHYHQIEEPHTKKRKQMILTSLEKTGINKDDT